MVKVDAAIWPQFDKNCGLNATHLWIVIRKDKKRIKLENLQSRFRVVLLIASFVNQTKTKIKNVKVTISKITFEKHKIHKQEI